MRSVVELLGSQVISSFCIIESLQFPSFRVLRVLCFEHFRGLREHATEKRMHLQEALG